MNELIAVLVTIMMAITSRHSEPEDQRRARLTNLATEMVAVTQDVRELAFGTTQARFESRLSARIGELKCGKHECDVTRRGRHRARGYWQPHRIDTQPKWAALWDAIDGPNGVRAMVQLQFAMQKRIRCGGDQRERFSAFSGGGCRRTTWGDARARYMERVEARIREELAR